MALFSTIPFMFSAFFQTHQVKSRQKLSYEQMPKDINANSKMHTNKTNKISNIVTAHEF